VPSGAEHSLAEDKVNVALFLHAERDADVPLGADRALSDDLLGGSLGGGYEGHGGGAA